MISTFQCLESDHRLTVLDYEETKTNGRYRAVINDAQLVVLHLQSVDMKDTQSDVSQLSLCPGVLESEVLETNNVSKLLIEKVGAEIVFR